MKTDIKTPERYEILEQIGCGATSCVYRANDRNTGLEVAVKVLEAHHEAERFQQEAEQLSELSHSNLIKFVESGVHEGQHFLALEYLSGGELESKLGELDTVATLKLFIQLSEGLHYLHQNGIVHRDIKPANILLDSEGDARIADLGAAKRAGQNNEFTEAGAIIGTHHYLAPEQIVSSDVGPSADIYSLGVCLFQALTGRLPFEGANRFVVLTHHLETVPERVNDLVEDAVPTKLDNLVAQLLEKRTDDRPADAAEIAVALQACLDELEPASYETRQLTWTDRIDELTEEQRSVLLALTYLGNKTEFGLLCRAVSFSEDRCDRYVDELIKEGLVSCYEHTTFSLNFPREVLEHRISPRVRRLYEKRLKYTRMSDYLTRMPSSNDEILVCASKAAVWFESRKSAASPCLMAG